MRHPLMDGNKRLALMGMVVFLDLNGVVFDAPEVALYHKLIAVLTREATAGRPRRLRARALGHVVRVKLTPPPPRPPDRDRTAGP
ncbi:MAG: hypothetical protein ACFBWO_01925 [Paracoccaceae bacterium]